MNKIADRRRTLIGSTKKGEGVLPSTYQQVEYIEGTGTQYIDTGVLPSTTIELEVCGMGGEDNGVVTQYNTLRWNFKNAYINTPETKNAYVCRGVASDNYHIVKVKGNILYFDETMLMVPYKANMNASIYIFARNDIRTSPATITMTSTKYKYLRFWQNDELILNFIPAKRNSDGEIGLYDTVNGVFYTNAGTGTFIVGPDVN